MRAVEGRRILQSLTNKIRKQNGTKEKTTTISTTAKVKQECTKCIYSDSEPELSSSELDSDECSLSWA